MSIHYLHTTPVPPLGGTDALYNELLAMHRHFGGEMSCLYPFKKPSSLYPPLLFGLHQLGELRRKEHLTQVNHLFSTSLFHLPFVWSLRRKVVYSIAGGLSQNFVLPGWGFLGRVKAFTVSNKRDLAALQSRHLPQPVVLIKSGIDTAPFRHSVKENPERELVLLMASAPWEAAQFDTKGIHLLLRVLQSAPWLRLIFVWRNLLAGQMAALIRAYGVAHQVELINEKVFMPEQFARAHGTLLLAQHPAIVKAYPHSLMESLLSGKPVIVSAAIPMSDFVSTERCGMVLDAFEAGALRSLLEGFRAAYPALAQRARGIDPFVFSDRFMLEEYGRLYEQVMASPEGW